MPTVAPADMLPQVIVNLVFAEIALLAMVPCTPSTGLTVVLKPLLPVIVQLAGGLTTTYLSVAVLPLRTRVGPAKLVIDRGGTYRTQVPVVLLYTSPVGMHEPTGLGVGPVQPLG